MKNTLSLLFLFLALSSFAQQDTVLTLKQSESLFLKNNLELLAANFNIDAAQAAIIQARTWDNPDFSFYLNAYNPEQKTYFDIGTEGQKSASLDQLFSLGGKRRNEVAVARANSEVTQLEFADLLRNLKLKLRQTYFSLYYQNLSYSSILKQISDLDTLVVAYQIQVQKGNIAMKDLVRLESLELNLKNQKTQLFENIVDFQSELSLITSLPLNIIPAPQGDEIRVYETEKVLQPDTLNHLALENRTDLQMAQKQVEVSDLNIKLQKSLAIPNLTVGAEWDQRGGAFLNQVGLNVGVPLPLWNHNKGNIEMAKAQYNEASTQQKLQNNKVISEVQQSLRKWQEATENYRLLTKSSFRNLEDVQNGIYANFKNGNLSLIEFTDFMESYHSTLMQYYQFAQNLVNACEQINYVTNSKIF
jgi:cobalt-zinc-cadmium efflux system outer membrane protein